MSELHAQGIEAAARAWIDKGLRDGDLVDWVGTGSSHPTREQQIRELTPQLTDSVTAYLDIALDEATLTSLIMGRTAPTAARAVISHLRGDNDDAG